MGGVELTADQIYEQLANRPPGNDSLFEGQMAASALEQTHTDLVTRIQALSAKMDAAWQGDAGQAAMSGAHPLAASLDQSATDLLNAKVYMTHQSGAFATASSSVKPIPVGKQVPQNGFWNEVTPWHTDLDQQISDYNASCDHNKQVFTTYASASQDNGSKIPQQYGTLQNSSATITQAPPPPGPGGPQYGGYTGATGSTSYSRTGGGGYRGGSYSSPRPIQGGGGGPVGGWSGQGSAQQSYRPPFDSGAPIGNDAAGFRVGDPGFNPNPGGAGFNGGSGGPGFNNAPGSESGGGFSGSGFGGGFGGSAGGPGGGFGAGSGAGEFGPRGSGGSSGLGPKGAGGASGFGAAEEGPLGRGTGGAGAAGKPGSSGAGGMGAGGAGAKGDEDGEHRSASYLQDDYSGEIVGDLGLTAPPVIGG